MLEEFAEIGSLYIRLKEIVNYLSKTSDEGLIAQSFGIAVSDYLQIYQKSLLEIESTIKIRRDLESRVFHSKNSLLNSYPSLYEIYIFIQPEIPRIRTFSDLCGCTLISPISRKTHSFSKQTYKSLENITKTHILKNWILKMSKGAYLLSKIYKALIGGEYDFAHSDSLRDLLTKSAKPLFEFLSKCIYGGTILDPYGEFFIKEIRDGKNIGITLSEEKIPIFMEPYAEGTFKYFFFNKL